MRSHSSDLVRDSKLDARFVSGATLHVYHLSSQTSRQRRIRTEDTWHRRRELGNGTYGRVWLEGCVSGSKVGQLRAVKEIPKDRSTASHVDYARELEAMAKFSHDKYVHCFVKSYGWYETTDSVFIAMEYLEHGDLQKHLVRPLREEEAKEIAKQLVEGITFMHSNGFAHRDLKPANILVLQPSPDWWVKIGDFGISKRSEEGITALRSLIGTKGYLAPEVIGLYPINEDPAADTERASYTPAVDIWSLGEIIFRMIANRPAFPEPRHLYNYVVKGHDFPSVISDASSDCRSFIEKAMAPSARLRLTGREAATHPWIQTSRPSSRASSAGSSRPTDATTVPTHKPLRVGSFPSHHLSNPSPDGQLPLVGTAQWTTLGPEDLTALAQVTEKPPTQFEATGLAGRANVSHISSSQRLSPAVPPDPLSYHHTGGSAIRMPPNNALPHSHSGNPDMRNPVKAPELVGLDAPLRTPRPVSPDRTLTNSAEPINALDQRGDLETPFAMPGPAVIEDPDTALSSRPATPSRVAFGAPNPAIGKGKPLSPVGDAQPADHTLSKPTSRQSRSQKWKVSSGLLQSIYSAFQPSIDRSASKVPRPNPRPQKLEDPLSRSILEPEQVQELIRCCTNELRARALDMPFFLLPFRPASDPVAVRVFLHNYFSDTAMMSGELLEQKLRITEPMVISGIIKWCWSRLEGGVVGWDAYELFKVGEKDSNWARDSFRVFIPLCVDTESRSKIIFDFFDLLAAIAAHYKTNGLGGRKLSRMAAWWAFQIRDTGSGFDGGYKAWLTAADATSHLFFAYLRSLSPHNSSSVSVLPTNLQRLLQATEYPPEKPTLMQTTTTRVAMIVDTVSPTPFALIRRGARYQYRDEDEALQEFSEYKDPTQALTEECRRVLRAISVANQTHPPVVSGTNDVSWSRFEDLGFSDKEFSSNFLASASNPKRRSLHPTASPAGPIAPSWADFLNSGFVDESQNTPKDLWLLPPNMALPSMPAKHRQQHDSRLHNSRPESNNSADSDASEPGELASLTKFDLDDAFWWVWMSSLAAEETRERKSAFGRCVVMEIRIRAGRWMVIEELAKGGEDKGLELDRVYTSRTKGFMRRLRAGSATDISRAGVEPEQRGPRRHGGGQNI